MIHFLVEKGTDVPTNFFTIFNMFPPISAQSHRSSNRAFPKAKREEEVAEDEDDEEDEEEGESDSSLVQEFSAEWDRRLKKRTNYEHELSSAMQNINGGGNSSQNSSSLQDSGFESCSPVIVVGAGVIAGNGVSTGAGPGTYEKLVKKEELFHSLRTTSGTTTQCAQKFPKNNVLDAL